MQFTWKLISDEYQRLVRHSIVNATESTKAADRDYHVRTRSGLRAGKPTWFFFPSHVLGASQEQLVVLGRNGEERRGGATRCRGGTLRVCLCVICTRLHR